MDTPHSIAILPFSDMSPQKDQEYFCDGLAEELIIALRAVEGLRVVPRTSSFRFRTTEVGVREIGRQLSVTSILEGSVRKAGDKLRVALNLIDTGDESSIWSERYDCNLSDVFAVQDQISMEIVDQLRSRFGGEKKASAVPPAGQPSSIAGYENYLRARYEWNKRTEESLKRSVDLFKAAIAENPDYALAHAGLADAYATLAIYGAVLPTDVMPKANEAALEALRLKENLPQAMAARACVQAVFEWKWEDATHAFQRAIELDPNYATARQWFAINCLAPRGRFSEAREQIEIACKVDPDSLAIRMTAGVLSYFERRFDPAIAQYETILETNADFAMAHYFLGQAYLELNRYPEAIAALEKAARLTGRSAETIALLGYAHSKAGNMADAVHLSLELTRRSNQIYVSPVLQAQIRAGLDDLDRVFEYLEHAYRVRSSDLIWIGVRPTMDPLRSDPRFHDLLRRVGFAI